MRRLLTVLLFLALIVVAGITAAFMIHMNPRPVKSQARLAITERENGSIFLSWAQVEGAECYNVQISAIETDGSIGDTLLEVSTDETSCALPELPLDRELSFVVTAKFKEDEPTEVPKADSYIEVKGFICAPNTSKLERRTSVDDATVTLSWDVSEGDSYQLYQVDENGNLTPIDTPDNGLKTMNFGENGEYSLPGMGEAPMMIILEATRETDSLIYRKRCSPVISIDRNSLMGTDPDLSFSDNGDNSYTLYWQETKGNGYKVELWDDNDNKWNEVADFSLEDERIYNTGHLKSNRSYHYRISVKGGASLPSVGMDGSTDEVVITTSTSEYYALIWPMKDLPIYATITDSQPVGTAKAAKAYCVANVAEGIEYDRFYIEDGTVAGYIDSRYCMINLSDYLGDLCSYDITNSYGSIFKVHEFGVNDITGKVLPGYENVHREDGTFLVPLLYPVAKKLEVAARQALVEGYRLKIYEAYRPHETTRFIYDTTNAQINNPVAVRTFSGMPMELFLKDSGNDIFNEKINGRVDTDALAEKYKTGIYDSSEVIPESDADASVNLNTETQQAYARSFVNQTQELKGAEEAMKLAELINTGNYEITVSNLPEGGSIDGKGYIHTADGKEVLDEVGYWTWAAFELKEINRATYTDIHGNEMPSNKYGVIFNDFITRNGFRMGSFLAVSGSRHNKGTALDLTLEDIETGEELKMQTAMHDLSVYSVTGKNNEMAKVLDRIMTNVAGFNGIVSEWWHFQDDKIVNELSDLPYLEKGIDSECYYTKDGKTFNQMNADGTFG